jgi:hypothetical protein
MTMAEIKEILRVKLETDEDPKFNEDEIINNLVHSFETQLPLNDLGC